ncbi:transposase [Bradyrhizobium manausense]|nr:transposase [Bradyrhizobium manausense]MBR1087730.1 transposase [Bradyrhizobium manausense]
MASAGSGTRVLAASCWRRSASLIRAASRPFRETGGRRAKTDRLDARLIARFALVMIDEIRPLSSAEQQALKALSPVDRDGRDREDAAQAGGRAHAVGKPPHPLLDEVCERIRRDAGSVLPAHATLVTQMAR